jgi:voltage-gated potassium channel
VDSPRTPSKLRDPSLVPSYRFGIVFLLLLCTFVFLSSAPVGGRWVPIASVVLQGTTLLAALVAAQSGRTLFRVAVIVVFVSLVAAGVALVGDTSQQRGVGFGLSAFLVFVTPFAILQGIWRRRTIDGRTILGALCIYVLLGMLWAFAFTTVQEASTHPFFVQTSKAATADFLYFSFVSLTTVGYGDLTAAGGFGRSLAVLEAMFGQMYLVTVVALLVTNLRPARVRDDP